MVFRNTNVDSNGKGGNICNDIGDNVAIWAVTAGKPNGLG